MPPSRYDLDLDLDLDGPSGGPSTTTAPTTAAATFGSTSSLPVHASALSELTLHWLSQRTAAELLPFPHICVSTLLSQMDQQQSILDSLSSLPPSDDTQQMEDEHLRLQCVLLDLERARWLLRSYLRTRLSLVEKHAAWLVKERQSGNAAARLSEVEWEFCKRYQRLREEHLHNTVLGFLPEAMRGLDDQASNSSGVPGKGDMVERPELDSPVFVRCLDECGSIFLPDGETANLAKDSVHFLRYRSVRHLVAQQRVQLI
ncbi:GINS complex subunit [Thecaphora frezii]